MAKKVKKLKKQLKAVKSSIDKQQKKAKKLKKAIKKAGTETGAAYAASAVLSTDPIKRDLPATVKPAPDKTSLLGYLSHEY